MFANLFRSHVHLRVRSLSLRQSMGFDRILTACLWVSNILKALACAGREITLSLFLRGLVTLIVRKLESRKLQDTYRTQLEVDRMKSP